MKLHRAGKISNARKGVYEGISISTFAMGTRALYDWLGGEGRELVRRHRVVRREDVEAAAHGR